MWTLTKRDRAHLEQLVPIARPSFEAFIKEANYWAERPEIQAQYHTLFKVPFTIGITDSKRDIYEQAGKYSQGRVWDRDTKIWTKTGPTVTDTILSKHVQGLAIDVAPFLNGKAPVWPEAHSSPDALSFWLKLASIGEKFNLMPGARFKKPDFPHFELK